VEHSGAACGVVEPGYFRFCRKKASVRRQASSAAGLL
jgi:hypothetical protein